MTTESEPRGLDGFERDRVKAIALRRLFGDDAAVPQVLGHYESLELIADGGMGRVYRAHDARLLRTVALKLVRPDRSDAFDAEALLGEARAAAAVTHPNVIDVYEVGEAQGLVYIAMRFVDGLSLERWLADRDVERRQLLDGLGSIADALAAAHRCGVVHRDVKPQNILVDADGGFHLGDFGLAETWKVSQSSDAEATGVTAVAGTPLFVAPELLDGHPATPASDVFSLGITLYRSIYSDHPFEGTTLRWVVSGASPPAFGRSERLGVVPWSVRRLLRSMLAVEPNDRPSAARVAQVLRNQTRMRRRWPLIVVAAGAVGVAFRPTGSATEERCSDASKAVLSEPEIRAVEGRLRALDAPFAAVTARRAEAFLRSESEVLREARFAACVTESSDVTCVDRRIGGLLDLHAALLDVDADQLARVAPMLDRLGSREHCEQVETDVQWADAVLDLRRRLERFDTLVELSALDDAKTRASALMAEAEALEHGETLAWAATSAGRAAARAGDGATAEVALATAFEAAVEADAPRWAARSLTSMVWTDATLRERTESADRLVTLGRAYIAELDAPNEAGVLEAELLDAHSTALDLAGRREEAAAASRRALEVVLALGGDHVVLEARVRANLAVALSNAGHDDESLRQSKAAYAVLAEAFGESHPNAVGVLNNLALQRLLGNDLDGAREDFGRVLRHKQVLYGPRDPRLVSTLLGLASVEDSRGAYDEAFAHLDRARDIAEAESGRRRIASVTYERARIALNAGRLDDALASIERTLELERPRAGEVTAAGSDLLRLRVLRARGDETLSSAVDVVSDRLARGMLDASTWERLYVDFIALTVRVDPCRSPDDPDLRAFQTRLAAESDPGELAGDVERWLACGDATRP